MAKKKIDFKKVGARVGGAAAGGAGAYGLDKLFPEMDPRIRAGIKLGVGAIVPEFVPEKNKTLKAAAEGFGSALMGAGGAEMMHALIKPAVEGVGNVGADEEYVVDVDDNVSGNDDALGGDNDALGGHGDEEEEEEN